MNIKGFRRMLLGEKMPDRNDPKYKERYERDVEAGRKFAKATRIDKAAAKVQGFANVHRTLFLVIVFAFVLGGLAWNIYRITVVYRHQPAERTATEMQDSVLRERHRMLQEEELRETGTGNTNRSKNRLAMKKIFEKINFRQPEVHAPCHSLYPSARCVLLHIRPVSYRNGGYTGQDAADNRIPESGTAGSADQG